MAVQWLYSVLGGKVGPSVIMSQHTPGAPLGHVGNVADCRLFNDKDMDLILLIVVPDTGHNRLAETEMHLKCNVFNGK